MQQLKELVEPTFENLVVEGELSGLNFNSSGHLYFVLKDETAQVDCALFSYQRQRLTFTPKNGDRVQVKGKLSIYEARGKVTFVVREILPLGLGTLLVRLEELKRKLASEGLFSPERKRSLPTFPRRVVLITSATGAAVHDMLRIFRQRGAWVHIVIVPTAVQGEEAPSQLVRALQYVNRWQLGEVIIIGRGGGSFEDLLPFSDEAVVRAIAESAIPVVSAVGHEVDNPLSDLAADAAAPTPTAAASLVWPHLRDDWMHHILDLKSTLREEILRRFDETKRLLRPFQKEQLVISIEQIMEPFHTRITWLKEGMNAAIRQVMSNYTLNLKRLKETIEAHSPLDILRRGYAIVQSKQGLVTQASQAPVGTELSIRLYQGQIAATSLGEKS